VTEKELDEEVKLNDLQKLEPAKSQITGEQVIVVQ
jgi:hypothetical protein